MLSGKSQRCQWRVELHCELLPWLLGMPLGLSRKRAKDLLRFRAVHVERTSRKREGTAGHAGDVAAPRSSVSRDAVRHDTMLEPGDVVVIDFGKQANQFVAGRRGAKASGLGLKIVFFDDAIVVIDKPAGLLSMGSDREKEKTAHRILNDYLKEETKSSEQQAFIVHRLDRETSGLMLFARNRSIQACLQQNWKAVTKRYLAVVEGLLCEPQGTLRDRLIESKSLRVHRVDQGGEIAITSYRAVEQGRKRSLVELTLETGRKHQIRVQLAGLGNPVVGDRKYGVRTDLARRLALHSCELRFHHPVTGASMEFRSVLPNPLRQLLEPA
jgi:23S rRNA pseudouridine1911/1915/1917 synthase